MTISFIIRGCPVAKGRPKFFRRGKFIGGYTPEKTRTYEDSIISQALQYKPVKPLENALEVEITFYLPLLKSFSKRKREMAVNGILRPAKRPDIDNLVKSCLDPLNKIFFNDDAQIVSIFAEKYYGETPMTRVRITDNIGEMREWRLNKE